MKKFKTNGEPESASDGADRFLNGRRVHETIFKWLRLVSNRRLFVLAYWTCSPGLRVPEVRDLPKPGGQHLVKGYNCTPHHESNDLEPHRFGIPCHIWLVPKEMDKFIWVYRRSHMFLYSSKKMKKQFCNVFQMKEVIISKYSLSRTGSGAVW